MIDSDYSLAVIEAEGEDERSPLAALRRFARTAAAAKPAGKCELCSTGLPAQHDHLLELRTRRLICCCQACGLLFSGRQSATYRRVPRTVQSLPNFRLSDAQWDGLLVPINLAFFYRAEGSPLPLGEGQFSSSLPRGEGQCRSPLPLGEGQGVRASAGRIVAVYPSPAGPVESLLGLEAWQAIVAENPRLASLQADVEALLVNRLSGRHLYYLVPIDECYRLSGLVRLRWRGLSGGSDVWEEVGRFFDRLKEKSCST